MFSQLNSTHKDIIMEHFDDQETGLSAEHENETLIITEDIRSYIYESAKWCKFLAIVGFIFTFMMVVAALSIGALMSTLTELPPYMAKLGATGVTILYLIFSLVFFYPSFLMYKFSSSAKQAVLYADQPSLSLAMSKMKSLFKFYGILAIIWISLYLIMILAGIMLGISAAGVAG